MRHRFLLALGLICCPAAAVAAELVVPWVKDAPKIDGYAKESVWREAQNVGESRRRIRRLAHDLVMRGLEDCAHAIAHHRVVVDQIDAAHQLSLAW